jgi:hypothetical protein
LFIGALDDSHVVLFPSWSEWELDILMKLVL